MPQVIVIFCILLVVAAIPLFTWRPIAGFASACVALLLLLVYMLARVH